MMCQRAACLDAGLIGHLVVALDYIISTSSRLEWNLVFAVWFIGAGMSAFDLL